MKTLSQMLEEIEMHPIAKDATLVPRASYDRMKQVAILLAKEYENVALYGPIQEGWRNDVISRAKDIIGGG